MATNKKWIVRFIAGNPKMFSRARTSPDSPMLRSNALDVAGVIDKNGWRGWVEDDAGNRIFETTAEKSFINKPA